MPSAAVWIRPHPSSPRPRSVASAVRPILYASRSSSSPGAIDNILCAHLIYNTRNRIVVLETFSCHTNHRYTNIAISPPHCEIHVVLDQVAMNAPNEKKKKPHHRLHSNNLHDEKEK
jgi:hypothetical protein